MQKYWLTFHWPQPRSPADEVRMSVYLQQKYRHNPLSNRSTL